MFLGGFLQPMFFQSILVLVVRGKCFLWSSKPCLARVFACVPFLHCLWSVIFKLWQIVDVRRKKTTDLVFNVLLFFRRRFVSFCSLFVLAFVLLEICQMWSTLLSVFYKKEATPATLPKWPPFPSLGSGGPKLSSSRTRTRPSKFVGLLFSPPTTHSCWPLLGYPKIFLHVSPLRARLRCLPSHIILWCLWWPWRSDLHPNPLEQVSNAWCQKIGQMFRSWCCNWHIIHEYYWLIFLFLAIGTIYHDIWFIENSVSGPAVSKYCARHLHIELRRHESFRDNLQTAIERTFLRFSTFCSSLNSCIIYF
jgi:hypothetical protein